MSFGPSEPNLSSDKYKSRNASIKLLFNNLIKSKEEIVKLFLDEMLPAQSSRSILTYMSQNNLNIFCKFKDYQKIILEDTYFYADGIGMHGALKYLGIENSQNISTDINTNLFEYCIENHFNLSLIGGSAAVYNSPKFRELKDIVYQREGSYSDSFVDEVVGSINSTNPSVVFIGMGVPLQEYVASEIAKRCSVNAIVCVGNFFEYYFGTMERAPEVIRKLNLEWVYRLYSDPHRLWKRYIVGIPEFIFRIIHYSWHEKNHKTDI